jgi:hypothetical protein
MSSNSKPDRTLESETAEIPTVAEVIAAGAKRRVSASDAAVEYHLETAQNCWRADEQPPMWVADLTSHLREEIEHIEQMRKRESIIAGAGQEYSLTDKIVTRAIGSTLMLVASPLIVFIWIGLKLERPDPAITMRTTGGLATYSFVLGTGWISRFVRYAKLRSLPSLWHLMNGNTVLRLRDIAQIINLSSARRQRS